MEDISPELLEKLRAAFKSNLEADEKGKQLLEAIAKGATYEQAGDYAECVGNALAKAFRDNLSSSVLPDGKMYWNIATDVVAPLLHENHDLCTQAALMAQKNINKTLGIGITPQTAEFNEGRASNILNKLEKAEQYDDVAKSLQRAVKNFSRGVVDDVLKTNAEFHSNSGLHPVIVRQSTGKCCEWCDAIAGTYKYPDNVPKVIYSRHDNCRCSVDYKLDKHSKTVQNVHSKQWTDEETLEKRKTVGLRQHTATETKAEREKVGLLGEDKRRPTVDNSGNGGIIKQKNLFLIDIQHFAEKDIKNQESASLRRAIRKYNKRIEEHKNKIENPSQYVPNWNDYSEKQKEGLIKHWKKEIYNFDESINNRIEELKKRGEQSE